jgi:pimeloyl-ACP methyl ester carboxylesterase
MIATASDGTRLHYIVEGTGPPIVLVGGKTSDIDGAWWRYIPVLAKRLKVIALDNRGAGASDKPDTPYSTPLMAEDALAVLRDVGETSAHWFGLSMGGMILQQLAISHPDAVRSLVLGATHCGGEHPRMGGGGTAHSAVLPISTMRASSPNIPAGSKKTRAISARCHSMPSSARTRRSSSTMFATGSARSANRC